MKEKAWVVLQLAPLEPNGYLFLAAFWTRERAREFCRRCYAATKIVKTEISFEVQSRY